VFDDCSIFSKDSVVKNIYRRNFYTKCYKAKGGTWYIKVFEKEEVVHVLESGAYESHMCTKNVQDTSNDIT